MTGQRGPGLRGMSSLSVELASAARRIVAELGGREHLQLAGVGWATVELPRAERELAEVLGTDLQNGFAPSADDGIMGAYCRRGRLTGGLDLVLLEPNTEGRLAGALARWGEAVVVAYVTALPGRPAAGRANRGGGMEGSTPAPGPLGPARLLASGPRGPHLILVEDPARHADAANPATRRATIAP